MYVDFNYSIYMRVIQSKLRKTNPKKISNKGAQSWCAGPGSAYYVAGRGGGGLRGGVSGLKIPTITIGKKK